MISSWLLCLTLIAQPAEFTETPTTGAPAEQRVAPDSETPGQITPQPPNTTKAATTETVNKPRSANVAVVCPRMWRAAITPWLEYREAQGHRIQLVAPEGSPEQLQNRLRSLARETKLTHIVLVGDAEPAARLDADVRARCVPTHLVRAKVNVHWGSEPEIASDNPYADLDGDGLPDVAIGRMPVDNAEELTQLTRRIREYERQAAVGSWQRQVNFVAGVGGFGKLADTVLEMATKKFLTEGIPPSYSMSMTYGSWRSPFCPDPRQFHQAALDRLNEGCLFWVYIGHGQRRYLDRVRVPGGAFHIFDTDDVSKLNAAQGAPIAIFLACYTAAFDEPRDCLAEEMLRSDQGPIAVLGGSRVTMPYAMAVMGNALMDEYFRQRRGTLGEILLYAKRRLAAKVEGSLEDAPQDSVAENRLMLDALARAISPAANMLDEERQEHVSLFNLLGDPLLRVPQPQRLPLQTTKEALAGRILELAGDAPLSGQGTIELVCRHDRMRIRAPSRSTFTPTHEALAGYNDVYRAVNNRRWTVLPVRLEGGPFRVKLSVPDEARGPCYVRVAVHGDGKFAVGSSPVYIRRPPAEVAGE